MQICIADICRQLDHYQSQYSLILQTPALFQQPVQDAYSSVWPLGKRCLCLGELLILWQSQKWCVQQHNTRLWDTLCGEPQSAETLYIYAIEQAHPLAQAYAQAWSVVRQEMVTVALTGAWRYVLYQHTSQHQCTALQLQCEIC